MNIQQIFEKLLAKLQKSYDALLERREEKSKLLARFEKTREFAMHMFNLLSENKPIWNQDFEMEQVTDNSIQGDSKSK